MRVATSGAQGTRSAGPPRRRRSGSPTPILPKKTSSPLAGPTTFTPPASASILIPSLVNPLSSAGPPYDKLRRLTAERADRCVRVAPVTRSNGVPPEGGTMHAIQSRAQLAEPAAAAPIARPALPIRRAAAEEALRDGDGPVELTFDVVRVGGATEAISMILERPDLERTLQSADGEELALVFDPRELERAIEGPEVEAQGLRETAAVLTVAVAAMAGSAGVASAAAGGASGTGYVVPAGSTGRSSTTPARRCKRHRLCRPGGQRGSDRQRRWRSRCERYRLCHPGGRRRSDRQRRRRGRCEWHRLCHSGGQRRRRSSTTPARRVQAAPAMSCRRVARRRS